MSAQPPSQGGRPHWLYRPGSARRLWIAGAVLLVATLLAEVFVHLHPAFGFDAWFGFNAVYGFLACVAMVLVARLLGLLVKRPEEYYIARRRPPDGRPLAPPPGMAKKRRDRAGAPAAARVGDPPREAGGADSRPRKRSRRRRGRGRP